MTEGKIKNKNLYVNVDEFSDKDINILLKFLENKFKLRPYGTKINLINNNLELNVNNINIIKCIIKPYILPSMKFKFIT